MISTTIKKYYQNDLVYLVLENREVIVTISPTIGGKILELKRKRSGTQFLLQPENNYSINQLPYYGADYNQYQPAGLDDCFPTMAASPYSSTGSDGQQSDIHFPDHGELWSIPWEYHVSNESVYLSVKGVRLDYEFSKTIRLEQSTVHVNYRLINCSTSPFSYIWVAHPFLEVQPGSKILFGQSVNQVLLDSTTDPTLGQPGTQIAWPWSVRNNSANSSLRVPPRDSPPNYIVKFFTEALGVGTCSYVRADTGEQIIFDFNPEKIPYIGIFLQHAGGSSSRGQVRSKLALQPSIGRPGSLQQACARKECREIDAFGLEEWVLRISVE